MNENVQFLKEHPVFQRLSEVYLHQLAEHMEVVNLDAGHTLFEEGESAELFYIVMEGTVDLYARISEDEEEWVQLIDVGEVIGWSWLVPPYRWAFSAKSREGAMLMQFDAKAIRDLCDRDPAFGYGTMKQICSLMLGRLHTIRAQMGARIHELQKGS
ncbi:MAG: cyclic nucleotide-binding domain-containing protein [Kiritimatiellae bacterium]|jgi:CRP/FNR family cyclic AMP-dependent transcriptional regulator|nr:cyclic nucleotide-binding domain-containing protein [Kiritimatiellia bacterium]